MTYKFLGMGDSLFLSTGYSNQTRYILEYLASKPSKWEVNHQSWHFNGMPIKDAVFTDGESLKNIRVLSGGQHPWGCDMIQSYINDIKPDVWFTLCDSVTKERIIITKDKQNNLEFLTAEELYNKYKDHPNEIKVLSAEITGKINEYNLNDPKTNKKYSGKKDCRRVSAIWKPVKSIERRWHTGNVIRILQKYGETRTTEKHSLIKLTERGLEKALPKEIIQDNINLVPIKYLRHERKLRKYNALVYNNRLLTEEGIKALMRIFGAYISEGCASKLKNNKNQCIIISNKDKSWLDSLSIDFLTVFNKKTSFRKSGGVYNLVAYSQELYNLFTDDCGKGSYNKKIPSFVFELKKDYQFELLNNLIKGDGSIKETTGHIKMYRNKPSFSYTTASLKLISQLSYLLKQLKYDYSIDKKDNKYYRINTSSFRTRETQTKTWKENYAGYVYDLIDVEDTNIFTEGVGLVLLHNSFMLIQEQPFGRINNWITQVQFSPAKSVLYFPSDGEPFPKGCDVALRKFDYKVAMAKFGQEQVKRQYGIDCDYIPHCLLPDDKIITARSIKPISEINIGDHVITHNKRFRRVTKIFNREIKEKIINISCYGSDKLKITENHPVFCFRNNQYQWVKSKDINKKDYLIYPILHYEHIQDKIYLSELLNIRNKNGKAYSKRCHFDKSIKNEILLTKEFYELLGWYLAEGRANNYFVELTLSSEETKEATIILDMFNNVFGINGKIIKVKNANAIRIIFNSRVLALFFKLFGRCSNEKKVINNILHNDNSYYLLKGLIEGDGCFSKRDITLSSSSIELIDQARNLLLNIGVICSTKTKNRICSFTNKPTIIYRLCITGDSRIKLLKLLWDKNINIDKKHSFIKNKIQDDYLLMKVKDIQTEDYCGPVFNLEVEEDESYTTFNYVVHNCTDTKLFYKMGNKEQLKAKWTNRIHDSNKHAVDIRNKKVVLCVARNQNRKMLDRVIKLAVEYFKEGKHKDTVFLLKSHPTDPASAGIDLMNLAQMYGVADKVCWLYSQWYSGFTITEMREVYNLADTFILPTSGEGWGIPTIEAMSSELPVLVTDFTTTDEITGGDERQKIKLQTTITGTFDVERGIADIDDFNKKLDYLMSSDESVRKEIGSKNRQKVLREYDTREILPIWEKYFEKMIHE